jgi:hypothetical protein
MCDNFSSAPQQVKYYPKILRPSTKAVCCLPTSRGREAIGKNFVNVLYDSLRTRDRSIVP